jgi:hypothetical protein
MNKLITIATLVLLCTNGFAQSKQANTVKRTVLTNQLIINGLLEYMSNRNPYSIVLKSVSESNQGSSASFCRGFRISYGIPLINLPQRNINSIAGLNAGVVSVDGNTPNIKGARADGTAYFIDGVRVYHFEPLSVF